MAGRHLRCTLPAASWGIKRQRTEGRRPSPPTSAFVSQDEEECILGLLMLSGAPLVLRKQRLMLPPRLSLPPAEAEVQEAPYLISFHGLMPLLPPPPPPEEQKQRRKHEPLSLATPSTADLRRYECSECGKVFFSYQALGGHKSSHRKRPAPNSKPEKQRRVKARRAMTKPSTSLTECSPKKGLGIDLNQMPAKEMD